MKLVTIFWPFTFIVQAFLAWWPHMTHLTPKFLSFLLKILQEEEVQNAKRWEWTKIGKAIEGVKWAIWGLLASQCLKMKIYDRNSTTYFISQKIIHKRWFRVQVFYNVESHKKWHSKGGFWQVFLLKKKQIWMNPPW